MSKIDKEKEIVAQMIALYCKKKHGGKVLCDECKTIEAYALNKLDHCRYGENKTFCSQCPTPCYEKEKKEQIREIMRFSGPRMIIYHPLLAIKHLLN